MREEQLISPRDRNVGFTLIELMVALALTVLISACLVEGLRFGQRAYERVVNKGGDLQGVYFAQAFIKRAIETAQLPTRGAGSRTVVGDSGILELVASGPLALATGGMSWMRFEVVETGNGKRDLQVQLAPSFAPSMGSANAMPMTETLVADIAAAEWSYRSAAASSQSSDAWQPSWSAHEDLPRAVRLVVTFAKGDRRRWPELIAMPLVTDRADCEFDAVAQRCRR